MRAVIKRANEAKRRKLYGAAMAEWETMKESGDMVGM